MSGDRCTDPRQQNRNEEMDSEENAILYTFDCMDPFLLVLSVSTLISALFLHTNLFPLSLGGDILAGITVASMLIPQSVSYAHSLAKLNPVSGLFSASIPGIIYAFLGSSRQLNVAPEAALSLLVGQAVNDLLHSDPHTPPEDPEAFKITIATVISLQAGLISFLLGFFRLGFIDVVLSRAMLQGFITAVAVLILMFVFASPRFPSLHLT